MIPGLRVDQWLDEWDAGNFPEAELQRKPSPAFLTLSMSANVLRTLSDVNRREANPLAPGNQQLGVQRPHDVERSAEIRRYVERGYPLSVMPASVSAEEVVGLRKPGWLATAIIVNIPSAGRRPNGRELRAEDSIQVPADWLSGNDELIALELPSSYAEDQRDWEPRDAYPIEVIDGQHRLWAFSRMDLPDSYRLPVIAFVDLDVSWQAYLFWTINIKPKRISPSLAFDLYPLLREQEWLERGEGLQVYRETRAQELTEALWSQPLSPWYGRINMLGERGVRAQMPVNQASFVRSLEASLVRPWSGRGTTIGGIFGGSADGSDPGWKRHQQIAFLIYAWAEMYRAVAEHPDAGWVEPLRDGHLDSAVTGDPAFYGPASLLSSDQGIRGFMQTLNDIVFFASADVALEAWQSPVNDDTEDSTSLVDELVAELPAIPVGALVNELVACLAEFDWRSSKAPMLTGQEQLEKSAYRGSSGYGLIRVHLLEHLIANAPEAISKFATSAWLVRKK